MRPERATLDALIESVADGNPIDWDRVDARLTSGADRRRLRHLRLIAGIAEVHRNEVDEAPIDLSATVLSAGGDGLERWGHLVLLEKIGEGSFGVVYRAQDPWLDREVAVKLLKRSTIPGGSTARIVHEARALARVSHLNVVTVHGAAVHGGRVGLWMELLRGQTLEEWLTRQGPFGAAEAAVIGQELCRALAAIHAAGLVHRDVKTTNVMREPGGRLVLMDLGAVQTGEGETSAPDVVDPAGTPLYLAPEVLAGGPASTRSDIYALGVLLFRLVTAEYPVRAASLDELRLAHRRAERRGLRDVRPDLPESFVAVIERALERDSERRFGSVGEVQTALSGTTASSQAGAQPRRGPLHRSRLLMTLAIAAVAVAGAVMAWLQTRDRSPAPIQDHVSLVAVLPFQNLSVNAGEAYLADAVPMELTLRLGQIGALKVVPWTFMHRFDDAGQHSLKEVAQRTGADVVIEGAVQQVPLAANPSARPVQIRVQVFHAATGSVLWSASFERDLSDFFALQAQIAREIAGRVHAVLARRDQILVSRTRKVSPEAMEDYLVARNLLEVHLNLRGAIALFLRAADREPSFAEAHVALSTCYALESAYFGSVASTVALKRAVDASNLAIALDDGIPEAWAARAFARFALGWDWAGAEADFSRALELGPNTAGVHDLYSNYLTVQGRHREAIAASRKADERMPLSASASRKVAWSYYMARQYDNAIRELRRTLDIQPAYVPALTLLGRTYLLKGMWSDAIGQLEGAGEGYEVVLALGYAMASQHSDATRLLGEVLSSSYRFSVGPYNVALVYAALGDELSALNWLETAYRERDPAVVHLGVDPMLDPLRTQPRFMTLLGRLQLQP